MMRKINLTLTGVLAVLAFVFTLGAGPIHARVRTFTMPACPINATTVPPPQRKSSSPTRIRAKQSLLGALCRSLTKLVPRFS
jgi:hypothetical protein